jgi:hypothetical protein
VHDVGLFGVQVGKVVRTTLRDTVHEREEDLSRAEGPAHGILLSSARVHRGDGYDPECQLRLYGVKTSDIKRATER